MRMIIRSFAVPATGLVMRVNTHYSVIIPSHHGPKYIMDLTVHQGYLLGDKNQLTTPTVDKYRLAGQITQTALRYLQELINDNYHYKKVPPESVLSIADLCFLTDAYIARAISNVYKKKKRSDDDNDEFVNDKYEKGIAIPTSISVDAFVNNFSPEIDSDRRFLHPGDIAKITLGTHIDGYTARVSHTIVVFPDLVPSADGALAPPGPLLGPKADAVCAAHIATELVVSLIALGSNSALFRQFLRKASSASSATVPEQITSVLIKQLVNKIAEAFHCVVVPGSTVRRVRRFLAGQADGVVAEKDFRGVTWSEADQEAQILAQLNLSGSAESAVLLKQSEASENSENSSEFTVTPGEVYLVDLQFAGVAEALAAGPGLVAVRAVDHYTGAKENSRNITAAEKPAVFVRDFSRQYQLKLRSSKSVLSRVDSQCSVYPFKLSQLSENFPGSSDVALLNSVPKIHKDLAAVRLGMAELTNHFLVAPRPVNMAYYVPLKNLLKQAETGRATGGGDEVVFSTLGITEQTVDGAMKTATPIPTAGFATTVVLTESEALRLTGGSAVAKPSWVHSEFSLAGLAAAEAEAAEAAGRSVSFELALIEQIVAAGRDTRFGVKVREIQPMKIVKPGVDEMDVA